jgi:protein-tyrosine sulfotransferase
MSLRRDISKYLAYTFDAQGFDPDQTVALPSLSALETAQRARGPGYGPVLFIHGIMPRSGTVYVGELLRLCPDLRAYPYEMWELPFLQQTNRILGLQRQFFAGYDHNAGKIGDHDFLTLFGASLIAYLHTATEREKRALVKVPNAEYLMHFDTMFPYEHLLLLLRDGRDVVDSTLRTWPQLRFWMVCLRWRRAANLVLAFHRQRQERKQGYWLARFEDAIADPARFVRTACQRFALDPDRFPFAAVGNVPLIGSSATAAGATVSWEHSARPADFTPVGRWQRWNVSRKWLFKRIAGQALIDLGYARDLDW